MEKPPDGEWGVTSETWKILTACCGRKIRKTKIAHRGKMTRRWGARHRSSLRARHSAGRRDFRRRWARCELKARASNPREILRQARHNFRPDSCAPEEPENKILRAGRCSNLRSRASCHSFRYSGYRALEERQSRFPRAA